MRHELIMLVYLIYLWCMAAWNSLYRVSRGRIRRMEEKNEELAEKMTDWRENRAVYNRMFRVVQFFIVSILAISVFQHMEVYLEARTLSWGVLLLVSLGVLCILLVISALLVRLIIRKLDLRILLLTLPLLRSLFVPVLKVSEWLNHLLEREEKEIPTAEDEIMSLVESSTEDLEGGSLEEEEKRMIKGVFELDDTQVREVMTPRVDLVALPDTATFQEAKAKFVKSGHSRIPIYSGTVDEIKGILYAKDFLLDCSEGRMLIELAHQPLFVPESKNISSLLKEFRNSSIHVAVIIDEYGGTAGVATLEDILEKIVGDIRDEYDEAEEGGTPPERQEDGSVVFEARTPVDEVNDFLDTDIPEDENVDTIGGFVSGEFGRIPKPGEVLNLEGIAQITIVKSDGRKVVSVKVKTSEE